VPGAGDLVITELMYNPKNTPLEDPFEWFEVYNPGITTYSLQGCVLSESIRSHTISTVLTIGPGEFVTFASSAQPGFTPDYVHNRDVILTNSGGSMTITCGSVEVDKVQYKTSSPWPASTDGFSIALDPAHFNATDNDDGANWCLATQAYGAQGNHGTPGVTNDSCACKPLTACPTGLNCGDYPDGCGGTLSCGTCSGSETCGGGGTPNVCGQGPCVPTTCVAEGAECGSISDGCGKTLDCGACDAPETCGGGGQDNICGCTPTTCTILGLNCGPVPDGCGGTLDCGTCAAPLTCGGGGEDNVCGCTPLTACPAGLNCGTISNGCGGTISCGTCTTPETCGGGGVPNVCSLPHPEAGQVIFSEIMPNPKTLDDKDGEWFELHNPTTSAFNLRDCTIKDNSATFTIGADLNIQAGGYLVFARSSSPGFTPDMVFTGLELANTDDQLTLTCASVMIDEVKYTSAFPFGDGVAMNLDPTHFNATDNDLAANWCKATESYNGDRGTPGKANTSCGCTPLTACPSGLNCGDYNDGCGGTISCGTCIAPQTCGGGGTPNVCGCTPLTACPSGLNCGDYNDGCGGTISCGTCIAPQTCGGGGTPNVCGCTPLTACPSGLNCGDYNDGCGGTISCGTCTASQTCGGGGEDNVCGLPPPDVGQVIFSEIMVDPTTVGDTGGEWFELHNPTTSAFDLKGCVVRNNSGSFTINTSLIIPSGGYLALANGDSPGFTPAYVYSGIALANGGDELHLTCASNLIDEVIFTSGFPIQAGKALNLSPDSLTATANDDPANWCIASVSYNGDLGTPGAANSSCGSAPTYTIGWCNLQFPPKMVSIQGEKRDVYGRVFIDGLTNQGSGPNPNSQVIGQVGFGSNDSDPTTWTNWTAATANDGFSDPANDEYMATVTIPTASATHYDYAFRFSGDGGNTWKYCDLDGSDNGYAPAQAGDLLSKTSHSIDWCRLQTASISGAEGTNATAYGQLYIEGLTDLNKTGNDPHPIVKGQVGYGPDASTPPNSWTWIDADPNPGWTPSDSNNDEYMATFPIPAASGSPYDLAFRFSGDDGATWTYCDLDGSTTGGYTTDQAGEITVTPVAPATLFFSEYIEGSSNNKAVEIYNPTGADVDISQCSVRVYSNAASSPSKTITPPASTPHLASGGVFVICHNSAVSGIKDKCDYQTASLDFNGDDAVELVCNGTTLDVIGQIGFDPGTAWGSGNTSTVDHTLVRKCGIQSGDTDGSDPFDPAVEWDGYSQDTFTYLGSHTLTCP
jgi:hypothetical protein